MNSRLLVLCFVTVLAKPPDYNFHLRKSDGNQSDERDFDGGNVGKRRFDEEFNFSIFDSEEETDSEYDSKYQGRIQGDSHYGSNKEANRTRSDLKKGKQESDENPEGAIESSSEKKHYSSGETTKWKASEISRQPERFPDSRKSNSDEDSSKVEPNGRNRFVDFPEALKDVETILPQDKVLLLPLIDGKRKPYDGYRAAPGFEGKNKMATEMAEERERRLNEGEIIYGKPKIAIGPIFQRRPLENPKETEWTRRKFSNSKPTEIDAESRIIPVKGSLETRRSGKMEFSGSFPKGARWGNDEGERRSDFSHIENRRMKTEPRHNYEKVDNIYENEKGESSAKTGRTRYRDEGESVNGKWKDGEMSFDQDNFSVASNKYSEGNRKATKNESVRSKAKIETNNFFRESKTKEIFRKCSNRLKPRNGFFERSKFSGRNETSEPQQRRYRRSAGTDERTQRSKSRGKNEGSDDFGTAKGNSGNGYPEGNGDGKAYGKRSRDSGTVFHGGNDQRSGNEIGRSRRETANVYGDSGETYGVPASIYADLFASEEEPEDGTFEKHVEEGSREQGDVSPDGRSEFEHRRRYVPGSRETWAESARRSRGRRRPKKFAGFGSGGDDSENASKEAPEMEEGRQRGKTGNPKGNGKSDFGAFGNREVCRSEKKGEFVCRVCEYGKGSTTHVKCRHGGNSKEKNGAFESRKSSVINERENNYGRKSEKSKESERRSSSIFSGSVRKQKFSVGSAHFDGSESKKPFDFRTAVKRERREAKEDFGEFAYDEGDGEGKTGRQENESTETDFNDFDDDFDDSERSGYNSRGSSDDDDDDSSGGGDDSDDFENDESETKKLYTFDSFSSGKKYERLGRSWKMASAEDEGWKKGDDGAAAKKPERLSSENSHFPFSQRRRDGTKMAEIRKNIAETRDDGGSLTTEKSKIGSNYENCGRNEERTKSKKEMHRINFDPKMDPKMTRNSSGFPRFESRH